MTQIKTIYLAGKITKNGWRETVVRQRSRDIDFNVNISDACYGIDAILRRGYEWPILENAIFSEYDYVGPFFIGCDHGCYHGEGQHGIGSNGFVFDIEDEFPDLFNPITRERTFKLCMSAIERADLIFAWIDDTTAYGTIAELGYAYAQNKQIWIAGPERFDAFWFVYQMADKLDFGNKLIPADSLQQFLMEYQVYRDSNEVAHFRYQQECQEKRNKKIFKQVSFDLFQQRNRANSDSKQNFSNESSLITVEIRPLRVFLSYSTRDKSKVTELCSSLRKESSIAPWMNEEDLLPGQNKEREIKKQLRDSDVIVVCLSQSSVSKEGFSQREIRLALDMAEEKPEDRISVIPLKLEECEIPDHLSHLEWVNYFDKGGEQRLKKTLQHCLKELHTEI